MCDVIKQKFVKIMQGLGIISLCDTWVPLVPPPHFVFFSSYFQKTAFYAISVE